MKNIGFHMNLNKFKLIIIILIFCLTGMTALYAVNPKAMNRRGVHMGEKKLYNSAIQQFDKSITHYDKFSSHVYHNKAYALEKQGKKVLATKFYEEALKRNPRQILTGENLGYLYYRMQDYINAVRIGEHVLKYDPDNRRVKRWLPDAYKKRLKQWREEREKELRKKLKEKEKLAEEKDREKEAEERATRKGYVEMDFVIRTGIYTKENNDYRFIVDPITVIPVNILLRFTPLIAWEFDLFGANPYIGSDIPDTEIFHEGFTALYKLSRVRLGIGFIFAHYQNNIALGQQLDLWDAKVGFIIGYERYKYEFRFTAYPRLLLYDGPFMTGKTYDISYYNFEYKYKVNTKIGFYVLLNSYEYWFFDHTAKISDYYGVYTLGFGITMGKLRKISNKIDIKLTIELLQRLYYKDFGNTNPYGFLNGQGFFGLNAKKFDKGDPISSFSNFGSALNFRIDEKVISNFFLYQKVILEMGYKKKSHIELSLCIGFGVIY